MKDKDLQQSVALWLGLILLLGTFLATTFFGKVYSDVFYGAITFCVGGPAVYTAGKTAITTARSRSGKGGPKHDNK